MLRLHKIAYGSVVVHLSDKKLFFFGLFFKLRIVADEMSLLHGQGFLELTSRLSILAHEE